jgi:hypothetical protein
LKVKRKIEKEHVYANVMKKEVKVNREWKLFSSK